VVEAHLNISSATLDAPSAPSASANTSETGPVGDDEFNLQNDAQASAAAGASSQNDPFTDGPNDWVNHWLRNVDKARTEQPHYVAPPDNDSRPAGSAVSVRNAVSAIGNGRCDLQVRKTFKCPIKLIQLLLLPFVRVILPAGVVRCCSWS
jgi:hypothetical protein